jgi:hypothetical protein
MASRLGIFENAKLSHSTSVPRGHAHIYTPSNESHTYFEISVVLLLNFRPCMIIIAYVVSRYSNVFQGLSLRAAWVAAYRWGGTFPETLYCCAEGAGAILAIWASVCIGVGLSRERSA